MADPTTSGNDDDAKKEEARQQKEWEERVKAARINLELSDPERMGEDEWGFTAVAIVTKVHGIMLHPEVNMPVQFALNEKNVDSPLYTQGNGRISYDFRGLKQGKYTVKVTIPDSSRITQKTIWVKEDRKLVLEHGEPKRRGNGWKFILTAIVTDRSGPVSGVKVRFSCDQEDAGGPVSTDTRGRATKEVADLPKGDHRFEAVATGSTVSDERKITIKDDRELTLDATEPRKIHGGWEVTATAHVKDKEGPVANTEVRFFLNGAATDPFFATDSEGRAVKVFALTEEGDYTFGAQIKETDVMKKVTKQVKDEDAKRPAKIARPFLDYSKPGSCTMSFPILAAEGNPASGAKVQITDHDGGTSQLVKVDRDGMANYRIVFSGRGARRVTAHVLGADLSYSVNVYPR